MDFDAIVIGSGMSGGIAAKELCERGLKVLMLERGRDIDPATDFNDSVMPWELKNNNMVAEEEVARDYPVQRQNHSFSEATKHFWVKDTEHPYITPEDAPFGWIRGDHLGGRSIMWGRQSYRMSPMDFEANALDGHGCDWPIRYEDLAPYYDQVERFIGVAGAQDGLPQLPDGDFLPPFAMNDGEKFFKSAIETGFSGRKVIIGRAANLSVAQPHHTELGRGDCQNRSICERGCSFGAMHSTLSSSLPAARRTGNLTLVTDAIVQSILQDPATGKATGVRVIDRNTKVGRTYEARIIFLNASTIPTAQILLASANEQNPNGLANGSDQVGRNLMDHISGLVTGGVIPGALDTYYKGRRPTGIYIPRFRNISEDGDGYIRGFGFQGAALRTGGKPPAYLPGIGPGLKESARQLGPWMMFVAGFGEMLPNPENRVTLHRTKTDQWGMPLAHIACRYGPNEISMASQMLSDGKAMIEAAGGTVTFQTDKAAAPGFGIHEMGTARMGNDPKTSVLNKYNQAHQVPNLFCTDGAAMSSSACQNPSLTYMALAARAAHNATQMLREGVI
ncbi:GMC oxidoreductase [Sphingomonas sp. 37zxx]|uniref:GMC oxidoreductase n=1 Tax=Sphingomonas sp. 37zxx TaxID=1550073 RepID=UPI00053C0294|nr:GMC family oxidoreductase [Sphingomonas sp. 37zxx]